MTLTEVKKYIRVDYTDDDELIELMLNATLDEMKELIPSFDPDNITNRQKILICAYIKEMYDNRGNTTAQPEKMMASLARLKALPGDYDVYPGHMEETTLERERRTNLYLRMLP